jgi:hypothetical protein
MNYIVGHNDHICLYSSNQVLDVVTCIAQYMIYTIPNGQRMRYVILN